jgi:hypothetical protein
VAIVAAAGTVAEGRPVTLRVEPDATDVLVLDATFEAHGSAAATSRRILSRTATLEPMRRLPPAHVEAAVTADGDAWRVELACAGDVAALEVRLSDGRPVGWPERTGHAYIAPGIVTLLPGERATLRVDWLAVDRAGRCLRVDAWNLREWILSDV